MNREEKSRNLSPAEYFEQIQKEYLIAELRSRIYYPPNDKRYYQKVMQFKKEKIEGIAQRNGLKSIFNDENEMIKLKSLLYEDGIPNFLEGKDFDMYYLPDNPFSYKGEIYTLKDVNLGTNEVKLEKDNKFIWVDYEQVRRIL